MSLTGVVMLTPGFHPVVGGAEKQALELSKALAAKGWSVHVLTRSLPGLPAEDTVAGLPVHRVRAGGRGVFNALSFMTSSALWLLRRAADYGAIHVHLAGSPALAACVAGRLLDKRVIVKVGGGAGIGELAVSGRTLPGRLKLALLRFFRPVLVAVTRELLPELERFGLAKGARVVPNGVDVRRYQPVPPERKDALRRKLCIPAGLCFLYVGRLAPEKRLPRFAKSFAQALIRSGARASLVIVGAGPEEAALRDLPLLLRPPTDKIEEYYAAADVFVLPSISEGLSNALLEAMASGLAVLASRVGGTREAVEEGVSGLLFAPADEEELAKKLDSVLSAPELAARLGRAAREAAVARFSLEKVAEEYVKIYQEGISAASAG
ncbi:MAG: glycosyltransferase family 4 protein [Elusimicrobiota bacterium]